jgi:hypothetical protein
VVITSVLLKLLSKQLHAGSTCPASSMVSMTVHYWLLTLFDSSAQLYKKFTAFLQAAGLLHDFEVNSTGSYLQLKQQTPARRR